MEKSTTIASALVLLMGLAACSSSNSIDPTTDNPPAADPPAADPPVAGFIPIEGALYVLQTNLSQSKSECFESNFLDPASFLEGASYMDSCQNVTGQQWRFINNNNGYYQLQSLFLEGANKCLEGNRLSDDSTLSGAAFMDDCQDVTGQKWSILDNGDNTFQLQTELLETENQCLEGNQVIDTATLGGAAFMTNCDVVTGQIWTATLLTDFQLPPPSGFTPKENTYYQLQTQLSQSLGQCFEGNFVDEASDLGGASLMTACADVTGQQWRFLPEADGFYKMQTRFLEGSNQCLESGKVDPGDFLGGASRMDDCSNVSGQLWTIIDLADGTFQLQSLFRQAENECLEGNQVAETSTLGGAAFMTRCENVTGQSWIANGLP